MLESLLLQELQRTFTKGHIKRWIIAQDAPPPPRSKSLHCIVGTHCIDIINSWAGEVYIVPNVNNAWFAVLWEKSHGDPLNGDSADFTHEHQFISPEAMQPVCVMSSVLRSCLIRFDVIQSFWLVSFWELWHYSTWPLLIQKCHISYRIESVLVWFCGQFYIIYNLFHLHHPSHDVEAAHLRKWP